MVEAFAVLHDSGVKVLTVGRYLRPSERHLPVVRYWRTDEFAALERAACELGFEHVAAGPLVRSSYHADEHLPQARVGVGRSRRFERRSRRSSPRSAGRR
jgi:lipoic acid synthetase